MYVFTEELEIVEDLSHLKFIPGNMCLGSTLVNKGKLFCTEFKESEDGD